MVRRTVLIAAVLALVGLVGLAGLALAQGPTATITAPANGATVSGSVPITGTAAGPNFAYYVVQFKLGDQWQLVDDVVHNTPVTTTGTLATWDTTPYTAASFDLRLLVADKAGQFITSTVSVKVDNTKTVIAVAPPRRGCYACHTQIAPDGRYTLAWEATNATKNHPNLPNGFKSTYQDCLTCHAAKSGTDMAGVVAPLSLRTIVHPAHLFSETFTEEFKGNCFACHNVDNSGKFVVLTGPVNVNDKGVPK
jgi:hypothetical protein